MILVGHSYGGMVITDVADRARDRIAQLVYLDAATPRNGESLLDLTPGLMEEARVVNGVDVVLGPNAAVLRKVHSANPEIAAWKKRRQTPHPWVIFTQPLRLANEAAMMKILRTNINCTPTLRVRPPDKLQCALTADHIWEIDTIHDLMVTEPKAVAEMLLRLAAL